MSYGENSALISVEAVPKHTPIYEIAVMVLVVVSYIVCSILMLSHITKKLTNTNDELKVVLYIVILSSAFFMCFYIVYVSIIMGYTFEVFTSNFVEIFSGSWKILIALGSRGYVVLSLPIIVFLSAGLIFYAASKCKSRNSE